MIPAGPSCPACGCCSMDDDDGRCVGDCDPRGKHGPASDGTLLVERAVQPRFVDRRALAHEIDVLVAHAEALVEDELRTVRRERDDLLSEATAETRARLQTANLRAALGLGVVRMNDPRVVDAIRAGMGRQNGEG